MDPVALIAPAYAWILAILALFTFGGMCAAALTYALGLRHLIDRQNEFEDRVATTEEVDRIAAKLHERLTRVEHNKGIPVLWARDDEATKTETSPGYT